jgi:hypothetical protein
LFELSVDSPSALTSLQATSFTLATLTFDAVGSGTSGLDLSVNALGDQNGLPINATLQNGSITVTGPTMQAPEINARSAVSGLTLLLGTLIVFRSRRSVS